MHSGERRGAHSGAHTPGRMANWDLVRIFLEVARFGSFRAAVTVKDDAGQRLAREP